MTTSTLAHQVKTWLDNAHSLLAQQRYAELPELIDGMLSLDVQALLNEDISVTRNMIEFAALLIPTGEFQRLERLHNFALKIANQHPGSAVCDFVLPLNNLGVLYENAGENDLRNEAYSQIVTLAQQLDGYLDSASATVMQQLANSYRREGVTAAALILSKALLPTMTEVLELPKETCIHWLHSYAALLFEDDQLQAAVDIINQALLLMEPGTPEYIDMRNFTGLICLRLNQPEEAKKVFRQVLECLQENQTTADETFTDAVANLAAAYFDAGEYDNAIVGFRRASVLRDRLDNDLFKE